MKSMPALFLSVLALGALGTLSGFIFKNVPVNYAPSNSNVTAKGLSRTGGARPDTIPCQPFSSTDKIPQRALQYASVGNVMLYGNMTRPVSLALFLSGDGGWNRKVADMAKALALDGQTLIVGIDIVKYYRKLQASSAKCLYPAGDMENLSEYVQKELHLPDYHKPVLIGYSSGATLTYGLLCQAPAGTFRGGVAMGFCPDIDLDKPLCEGSGKLLMKPRKGGKGFDFTDQPAPTAPLEVLQGEMDGNCDCQTTCNFFERVQNVHLTRLANVGHGFSVTANWLPQFKKAFERIMSSTNASTGMVIPPHEATLPVAMASLGGQHTDDEAGLPLNITTAPQDASQPMVVFISGDGGWTGFDQQICDQLATRRLPTVGLNSQSYFWKKKTPETTVADLTPVWRAYLQSWGKTGIIVVGYSFGANVAPFILNRLPSDLREKVKGVVLLSPDTKGDFEIHVAGMLGKGGGPYDVIAEVRSVQKVPVLCVRGDEENDNVQSALQGAAHVRFEKIPGSHHYNNDAAKVAAVIGDAKF